MNEIMPFTATWMSLEIITLSKSDRERQIYDIASRKLKKLCKLVQFISAAQLCPTLCDIMDCSMPGFPVRHQLPELIQTHVHQVGDAIHLSHPLLSPSPPALNLSPASESLPMNQFFSSGGQILELQLQHQSFQ